VRVLVRQLGSEGRKVAHPLPVGVIVATSCVICLLQWKHASSPYPGPSVADLSGCVRIASLQYATSLGFVVSGAVAAMNTADELSTGSISDALMYEPRRSRLAILKISSVFATLLTAWLVAIAGLWITGSLLRGNGVAFSQLSRSSLTSTVVDVAASLPVMIFIASVGVTVALLTRSQVVTIVLTPALFALPLPILGDRILWAWPTRWIVEWLHLDPFGNGVDYLADISPYDHRGLAAVFGGCALGACGLLLIGMSGRLLDRGASLTREHV
jgi:hypothetical protein